MPASMMIEEKTSIMNRGMSTLILSLGDKVLIEVRKESTPKALWDKVEMLYNAKT